MMSARADRILVKEVFRFLRTSQNEDGEERVLDVFHSLARQTRESCRVTRVDHLERLLSNHPELFQVRRHIDKGEAVVNLTTTLTLCPVHSNRSRSCSDKGCNELHICTFYLLSGNCKFGKECLFGHSLSIRHNREVLDSHGLANLDIKELGQVLSLPWVRQGITVPKVCTFYNQLRGCHSKGSCHSFHLCLPYVLGQCKFKERCKRNHDVTDQQVTQTLASYGIPTGRRPEDILREIKVYQTDGTFGDDRRNGHVSPNDDRGRQSSGLAARGNRFRSEPDLFRGTGYQHHSRERVPSATRFSQAKRSSYSSMASAALPLRRMEQLCLFHLQDRCHYGENCRNLHSDHPFLWRVAELEGSNARSRRQSRRKDDDITWISLHPDNNIKLETYFSQPDVCECTLDDFDGSSLKVNFRSFLAESDNRWYKIRRLEASSSEDPSSVGQTSGGRRSIGTVWNWYWRDKSGEWNLFDLEGNGPVRLPWRSDRVERTYLGLTDSHTPLECGHYSLAFNKMRLTDLDSGQKFKVRRRPQPPVLSDEDTDESDETSQTDSSDEESERGNCARSFEGEDKGVHDADAVTSDDET